MKIFSVTNTYKTNEGLRCDLAKINKIAEKNLEELSLSEFSKLIALYERSSVSLRRILEISEIEDNKKYFIKNDLEKLERKYKRKSGYDYLENLTVQIEKQDEIYHLLCPYTFKKPINESFYIADNLRAAVAKERQNGMEFEFKGKQLVIALRIDEENFKNTYRYKDNDNLEVTEMINFIFSEACAISDNIKNMSYMSHYMESNDEELHGFHMFILPYDSEEIRPEKILKKFYPNKEIW